MKRVPANAGWLAFNSTVAVVFMMVLSFGRPDWTMGVGVDSGLEAGKWAFRLLLVSLAMTPLRAILGWNGALDYRKPAGLWAFAFAAVHFLYFVDDIRPNWAKLTYPPYLAFGVAAIVILTLMALTSYRAAMRRLGKWWKRLHRLVYVAGGAICVHALQAAEASKRLLSLDAKSVAELYLYAAVMAVLLSLRLPRLWHGFRQRLAAFRLASNAPTISPIRQESIDGSVSGLAEFTPIEQPQEASHVRRQPMRSPP